MNGVASKIMVADFDSADKRTPVAIYPTKSEQRGNRPDLSPIPVSVTPLFFEEYYVRQPFGDWKCVGISPLEKLPADRKLGWEGKKEFTATESLNIMRCFRPVVIKASVKRPLRVRTLIQALT